MAASLKYGNPNGLDFSINDHMVLLGYRGSIAHGTYVAPKEPTGIDDKDLMGIFIPPIEYYLGMKKIDTVEWKYQEFDNVCYEFRHMVHLLSMCNPNVMSLLFLTEPYVLMKTTPGTALIENRSMFCSKKAYHSYVGYARGQLHRMTHWDKEKAFTKGYMGEKRKSLVEKYGYDVKNAAHLIRILRMGIEFLSTGELQVLREDAQELIEIKTGQWTIEKVKAEADKLFGYCELALINSKLPDKPDLKKIQIFTTKILCEHFREEIQGW